MRSARHLPLDGVPVSIKDHFDVEGMLHTEGDPLRLPTDGPPVNSAVVQRLLDAGAFVVGKSNQPDFQIRWNTVNDLYGATRNPRDTSLTAGGSSGGDTAAVASGMAALGLGADYGGLNPRARELLRRLRPSSFGRPRARGPGARSREGRDDPRPDELTGADRPHARRPLGRVRRARRPGSSRPGEPSRRAARARPAEGRRSSVLRMSARNRRRRRARGRTRARPRLRGVGGGRIPHRRRRDPECHPRTGDLGRAGRKRAAPLVAPGLGTA